MMWIWFCPHLVTGQSSLSLVWSNQLMISLMITQLAKKGIFVFQILKWKKTMSSDSKIAIFPSRGAQTLMKVGSSSKGVKLSILIFTQWSHNFDIMHIFISRVDWKGPRKDILFWRRKQTLCRWNLGGWSKPAHSILHPVFARLILKKIIDTKTLMGDVMKVENYLHHDQTCSFHDMCSHKKQQLSGSLLLIGRS